MYAVIVNIIYSNEVLQGQRPILIAKGNLKTGHVNVYREDLLIEFLKEKK